MQTFDQAELTSADVLFMALRDLGVTPSVDSFESRKRIQKLGYVLQKCGILPSYGYTWYLHGPYASDLTSDLYTIATNIGYFQSRNQTRTFVPSAQERLAKLTRILGPAMDNTPVLEALASLLYLGTKLEGTLRNLKPALSTESIGEAKRLLQELQREQVIENQ